MDANDHWLLNDKHRKAMSEIAQQKAAAEESTKQRQLMDATLVHQAADVIRAVALNAPDLEADVRYDMLNHSNRLKALALRMSRER